MTPNIHSTAIVAHETVIGEGVEIGPYAIVENGAIIGRNSEIQAHAIVKGEARIGDDCLIGHFSVVGGLPQHADFDPSIVSFVEVGEKVRMGEGVTVHRSIYAKESTLIGKGSFLMGNSHVAHDCKLGKSVVLANGVLLGGHVEVGDHSFIGGGSAVHQFIRVGEGSMIGGMSEISRDVSPQITVSGRNLACGLNMIGLKRRGASTAEISELKKLYRLFLASHGNLKKRAENLLASSDAPSTQMGKAFVQFFISGERNFAMSRRLAFISSDGRQDKQN